MIQSSTFSASLLEKTNGWPPHYPTPSHCSAVAVVAVVMEEEVVVVEVDMEVEVEVRRVW